MRISSINTTYTPVNFHNPQTHKNTGSYTKEMAIKKGLGTAGGWFGFGIVLDMLSRHIKFSKSPTKNSLAINGLIGTCAGVVSGMSFLFEKNKL